MAGGLIGLERSRLPGAPREYQIPPGRRRQGKTAAHTERLGPRHAAHIDRRAGELPAAGWLDHSPGGAAPVDGRHRRHQVIVENTSADFGLTYRGSNIMRTKVRIPRGYQKERPF